MSDDRRHCFVSGRVQGVFFRASTHDKGRELGIEVRARNLPDGRVEVLARGPSPALDRLVDWLHEGPPQAHVTGVTCESISAQDYERARWR